MITILQQFYKALVATMTACKHRIAVQDEAAALLTEQLQAITAERDVLVAEQEEVLKLIDEMTEELDKK